ncbi:hypothetical protein R3P38DRAFT_3167642 [Favolaschia claudopus]|uniref:Uncharacterized protein n=1 Tax=Favolaschia claudopus TaxID=2862362 RepID=A0AAW0AMT3_9AGAR
MSHVCGGNQSDVCPSWRGRQEAQPLDELFTVLDMIVPTVRHPRKSNRDQSTYRTHTLPPSPLAPTITFSGWQVQDMTWYRTQHAPDPLPLLHLKTRGLSKVPAVVMTIAAQSASFVRSSRSRTFLVE